MSSKGRSQADNHHTLHGTRPGVNCDGSASCHHMSFWTKHRTTSGKFCYFEKS